jgi:hypothetical protein
MKTGTTRSPFPNDAAARHPFQPPKLRHPSSLHYASRARRHAPRHSRSELHAATSLARFWRDQGKRTEARDLLAPIYNWFTEGFDTPVLKDAKALLDELA